MTETTYDQTPSDRAAGPTVLIADDEELGREQLTRLCSSIKVEVPLHIVCVETISKALETLSATAVHLLLLDKNFVTSDGTIVSSIQSIPDFLRLQPHLQILVITGDKEQNDTAAALELGALSYMTKDSSNNLIRAQIMRAIEVAQIRIQNARLEKSSGNHDEIGIAGHTRMTKQLLQKIAAVSESNKPVLLLGETGTGKTTIARRIHKLRSHYLKQDDRPFFEVNIATLAPTMVERELFGAEKGAYTGSVKTHQGFIELANNGTLFLDEIAEISLDIQAKLLSVLQDGKFRRIGGTEAMTSSFRLVCATNRNLERMVETGKFREDLYMRISTFPIVVPSLKERQQDIPDIIQAILPKLCRDNRIFIHYDDLPKDFIEQIIKDPPKGNVRGIEDVISRLLVYSPKDSIGRPILKEWRSISGLDDPLKFALRDKGAITLEELLNRPLDVSRSEFPGFNEFLDLIANKLVTDTKERVKKSTDVAKVLKMSDSTVSLRLKRIKEQNNEQGSDDDNQHIAN